LPNSKTVFGFWPLVFVRARAAAKTKTKVQSPGSMQIRSILFPTDFSECGNYALSYAAALARTFGASVICVHVIEPMVPTVGYSGMSEPCRLLIFLTAEDSAERELPKIAECEECAGLESRIDRSRRSGF